MAAAATAVNTAKINFVGTSEGAKKKLYNALAHTHGLGDSPLSTIGVDYLTLSLKDVNGASYKVLMSDTAGQERFRAITAAYYKTADSIILVVDFDRANMEEEKAAIADFLRTMESTRMEDKDLKFTVELVVVAADKKNHAAAYDFVAKVRASREGKGTIGLAVAEDEALFRAPFVKDVYLISDADLASEAKLHGLLKDAILHRFTPEVAAPTWSMAWFGQAFSALTSFAAAPAPAPAPSN